MPSDSHLIEGTDPSGEAHTEFDYSALDSLEDRIREAIQRGSSITALVSKLVEHECTERTNEAIAAVLCYIADARKPKLAVDYIAYATGMRLTQGQSASALARKHRIRKQAFSQAALRIIRSLGLQPSRAMRSVAARKRMAEAYRARVTKR